VQQRYAVQRAVFVQHVRCPSCSCCPRGPSGAAIFLGVLLPAQPATQPAVQPRGVRCALPFCRRPCGELWQPARLRAASLRGASSVFLRVSWRRSASRASFRLMLLCGTLSSNKNGFGQLVREGHSSYIGNRQRFSSVAKMSSFSIRPALRIFRCRAFQLLRWSCAVGCASFLVQPSV